METSAAVYHILTLVPQGRVTTYQHIATLAGMGRGARQVGRLLRQLPPDTQLPWHRVINSRGCISLPVGSEGYIEQRERLEQEGVVFHEGRANLSVFGWGA